MVTGVACLVVGYLMGSLLDVGTSRLLYEHVQKGGHDRMDERMSAMERWSEKHKLRHQEMED